MKISAKLILSFILVAVIAGVVGVVGINNINTVDENGQIIYENMTVPLAEAAEIAKLFQRFRVNTRDMILEDDPIYINEMYSNTTTIVERLDELSEAFGSKAVSQEMKDAFAHFMDTRETFGAMIPAFYDLCIQNRDEEAYALIKGDMRVAADAERDAIDAMVAMKVEDAAEKANDNEEVAQSSVTTMITLIVV